jgi:ABC-type transport system substrate-binding protein
MSEQNYWSRLSRKRLSRRTMLGASAKAGVGAAGLALVGCGDDDDDAAPAVAADQAQAQVEQDQVQVQAQVEQVADQVVVAGLLPGELTAAEEAAGLSTEEELRLRYHWSKLANLPGQADGPQHGGSWKYSSTHPGTWNPLGASGSLLAAFALHYYNQLVSFPLGDFDNNNNVTPEGDLATGWETPDPETWVFSVDQEIAWQDLEPVNGRDMTMEDIAKGYDALREAPVQARDYAVINTIDSDEAGRTVRFNLTEPAPYLINVMTTPYHVIIPPELIGTDQLDTSPVGSGPYILKEQEIGVRWFSERNPNYFRKDPRNGNQLPYLDSIEGIQTLGQREAEIAGWATGDLMSIVPTDLIELEELQGLQPNGVTMTTAPPPGWQPYVAFQMNKEPWGDPRVRQALSALMDRAAARDGLWGGFAGAGIGQDWTFFPDETTSWGGREWPWSFEELQGFGGKTVLDVEGGNALLDAAGITPDNPLEFEFEFHSIPGVQLSHAQLIVDQWQTNSGGRLKVNFITGEWLNWFGRLVNQDWTDVLKHYQYGPAQDPDQYTYGPMHSESAGNFYSIDDAEIDEWSQAQRTEVDPVARQELWEKIMRKDLEQAYRLWTVNPYRMQIRREWMFNHSDTYNAWNPGWGEKGAELLWLHKELQANA